MDHNGRKKFEIYVCCFNICTLFSQLIDLSTTGLFWSRQKCAGKCAVAVRWSPYDSKVPKTQKKNSPPGVVEFRDAMWYLVEAHVFLIFVSTFEGMSISSFFERP